MKTLFPPKVNTIITVSIALSFLFSCATITGGRKYNAHIIVNNDDKATVEYNGEDFYRKGLGVFKVKRSKISSFSFIVKKGGCENQSFSFTEKTLRVFAFITSRCFNYRYSNWCLT